MKTITTRPWNLAGAILLLVCLSLSWRAGLHPAHAYQFRYEPGQALPSKWNAQVGPVLINTISELRQATFEQKVEAAIAVWNGVKPGTNLMIPDTVQTQDEINAGNFEISWGIGGDNKLEVFFDETAAGELIVALGRNPEFTGGTTRTFLINGTTIVDAVIVINGLKADVFSGGFGSTTTHELGHLLGLSHSSVGMHTETATPSSTRDRIAITRVPTMHPELALGTFFETLEPDDRGAISELYGLDIGFGTIRGTVLRCDNEPQNAGEPVLGVNVRAIDDSDKDLQISRYSGFDRNTTGAFEMKVPNGTYKILIEPLTDNWKGGQGVSIRPLARIDSGFPSEFLSPPETESACTENIPEDDADIRRVAVSGTVAGLEFRVGGIQLGLIIDDTGSMFNEIAAVQAALTAYIDDLRNREEPFPNTVIMTLKDDVTNRLVSRNPDDLQTVVNGLFAAGGADCPESSNAALLDAGRMLAAGGVAVFATDADSRPDGPTRDAVVRLFRSKSLTLSTALSGACTAPSAATTAALSAEVLEEPVLHPADSENSGEPPEPTLGIENAVRTFSEISLETAGIFTAIPGVKFGDPEETQRYINTFRNIALSAVGPAVALVQPGDGPVGSRLDIEVTGGNTNFQSSSQLEIFGAGITVNSITVLSPQTLTANLTVLPGAAIGFRDVTVATALGGGVIETATGFGAFQVVPAPFFPAVIGAVPSRGAQGDTIDVTISAANTNFVNGLSEADFGPGITVNATTVLDPTTAVANITIAANAVVAFRNVFVFTGGEIAFPNVFGPFLVIAPPPPIPALVSLDPTEGMRGETLDVAIEALNTNFEDGVSLASFSGDGITVNSTAVNSPTMASVNITIDPNAEVGFRDAFVATGVEKAAILNAFQVTSDQIVVAIDIKPGTEENPINLGSDGNVPVAVLTTSTASGDEVDFDASQVDAISLSLEGSNARQKGQSGNFGSLVDVDGDGDLDLVVQFPTVDLDLTESDIMAMIEGTTLDGTAIQGSDSITVVPAP